MFKRRKKKGFTIIEVMIVLAIAALIMSIVFVAAPALRRSGNNNARITDANLISSAVESCLGARNRVVASCNGATAGGFLSTSNLKIISTILTGGGYAPDNFTAVIDFGRMCDRDGSNSSPSTTPNDYTIFISLEGSSGGVRKCVGTAYH